MYNRKMNIYVRENISMVELWSNRKVLKVYQRIRNIKLKRIYKFFLKIAIVINYYIKLVYRNLVQKDIDNCRVLIIIPTRKNKLIKNGVSKAIRLIQMYGNVNLIFSKNVLKVYNNVVNNIEGRFKILDGNILYRAMLEKVIIYIMNQKQENLKEKSIYFLVDDLQRNTQMLEYISGIVKNVNIVTSHIDVFQKFADKLYNTEGIMITVSNNSRKSLRRAEIIVNVDFTAERIGLYNLNRTGIIINLSSNLINLGQSFEGIIVNQIRIKNEYTLHIYDSNTYYESFIVNSNNYKDQLNKIKNDGVEIEYLIGNRGRIDAAEYVKIT